MLTVHDHVANATHLLRAAGIPSAEAELDARLLAREVLGWDAATYLTSARLEPPADFADRYLALVSRREKREPVTYILGRHEFWNLTFEVTPAVLIPRPESEMIIEAALELFADRDLPLSIADVGTGSGCLAISLALEFPRAAVTATDVSQQALEVAARNAQRHCVADRVKVVHTDLLTWAAGPYDLIVCNPPYVALSDRAGLQPEVAEHEPARALFGGADGLDVVRDLLEQAPPELSPGGALIFEFGFGQAEEVSELISQTAGLTMVGLKHDLQGIPRTAVVRRA
jgi:release factor glutamine methyltransferase